MGVEMNDNLEKKFTNWLFNKRDDLTELPFATQLYKAYIEGYNQKIEDNRLNSLLEDLKALGVIDDKGYFIKEIKQ